MAWSEHQMVVVQGMLTSHLTAPKMMSLPLERTFSSRMACQNLGLLMPWILIWAISSVRGLQAFHSKMAQPSHSP